MSPHTCRLAVMVENVPGFFGDTTIAGRVLMAHLERLGYHVHYFEVNPWDEWAEPQDRRRGVMVATLFSRFYPYHPGDSLCGHRWGLPGRTRPRTRP